jgi:hypothetical protein
MINQSVRNSDRLTPIPTFVLNLLFCLCPPSGSISVFQKLPYQKGFTLQVADRNALCNNFSHLNRLFLKLEVETTCRYSVCLSLHYYVSYAEGKQDSLYDVAVPPYAHQIFPRTNLIQLTFHGRSQLHILKTL